MLIENYPQRPLPAIPQVLLDAFLAEREIEDAPDFDALKLDEVDCQRAYALHTGARERAATCGRFTGHAEQAAAMLMAIDRMDDLILGRLTVGGHEELRKKLDAAEIGAISEARDIIVSLLDWHFREGAGALLPIARFMGLVDKRGVVA